MSLLLVTLFGLLAFYVLAIAIGVFSDAVSAEPLGWPRVDLPVEDRRPGDLRSCSTDADCLSDEKCFQRARGEMCCVETLARDCNPNTGSFVLVDVGGGALRLRCECKYPDLVTQSRDGANCEVDVACGMHGHLRSVLDDPMLTGTCVCDDEGHLSTRDHKGAPICRRKTEGEQSECHPFELDVSLNTCACPDGYVSSNSGAARKVFHPRYLAQFPDGGRRCLRLPCTFNALNPERKLRHGTLEDEDHCSCDARFGLIGVRLSVTHYLRNEGGPSDYNACASVFDNDDDIERQVKLYCYYYMEGMEPVCFVTFENIRGNLAPAFEGAQSLTFLEPWGKNNFAQQVLRRGRTHVRARGCTEQGVFLGYHCEENDWKYDHVRDCHDVYEKLGSWKTYYSRVEFYNWVYFFPLCHYRDPSFSSSSHLSTYHDTVILNPSMITKPEFPELLRSNGFRISPYMGHSEWAVEHAVSDFRAFAYAGYPNIVRNHVAMSKEEKEFRRRVNESAR